jgi:hypothetical protein
MIAADSNARETRSLHFFMGSVLAALAAKLGELEAASGRLLVLGGGVVFVLAISTLELNDFAGHLVKLLFRLPGSRQALSGSEPGYRRFLFEVPQGLKPLLQIEIRGG